MSAYVVESETIHKIISGIVERGNEVIAGYRVEKDWDSRTRLSEFGQAMLRMNESAVGQRYHEHVEPTPYQFQRRAVLSHVQTFKALRCFLYQCGEGDVPQTDLYRALWEYLGNLAIELVSASDSYRSAHWG